jgi:hypothetical protein
MDMTMGDFEHVIMLSTGTGILIQIPYLQKLPKRICPLSFEWQNLYDGENSAYFPKRRFQYFCHPTVLQGRLQLNWILTCIGMAINMASLYLRRFGAHGWPKKSARSLLLKVWLSNKMCIRNKTETMHTKRKQCTTGSNAKLNLPVGVTLRTEYK